MGWFADQKDRMERGRAVIKEDKEIRKSQKESGEISREWLVNRYHDDGIQQQLRLEAYRLLDMKGDPHLNHTPHQRLEWLSSSRHAGRIANLGQAGHCLEELIDNGINGGLDEVLNGWSKESVGKRVKSDD